MTDSEDFLPSDCDSSDKQLTSEPVSILKHLPQPRQLLCPTVTTYELYSPRCLYANPLTQLHPSTLPKAEIKSGKPKVHRLLSIEDALFQHYKIKQQVRQLNHKKQNDCSQHLWDLFCNKEMCYNRFNLDLKKNNFASIFMTVAGVSLESKKNQGNFPQIKNKANKTCTNSEPIIFDSHFESGNLLYAFRSSSESGIDSYDLVLQNDVNTRGHNQWFYFKVNNTHKNQKVRFNIVNLIKKESLFSYGLKPLVFSEKAQRQGVGWHRNGIKVFYQQNNIKREHRKESYYTLSFEYQFRDALDTVYFSPSYPYTYTQLLRFLDGLLSTKSYQPFLSIKKLCDSPGGNAINLITISTGKKSAKECKVIWILGRQHPVQTTSSFMLQGIIQYLLSLVTGAHKNQVSFYDSFIFKIVPMVNPDGVIHGNTRAQLTGVDPNRTWKKPSKTITPAIYHIKKQILRSRQEVTLVLDLHSHSKKLGCFFYGNYSSLDTSSFRLLPSLVCSKDTRFHYKNCRFRGGNQNSARRTLYKELGIPNIFTVECSLLGYVKENNRISQYKITDYQEMGKTILETFFEMQSNNKVPDVKVNYPHEAKDFCDAQSARSDSCVSQDEYQEVYRLMRAKRKPRQTKKSKPKSNANIKSHKYHTSQHPRQSYNSSVKIKDHTIRSQTLVPNNRSSTLQKNLLLQKQPFGQHNCEQKEDNLLRLKGKYNSRNIRLTTKKKINKTIKNQIELIHSLEDNKTFDEKSIQVQDLKTLNFNDPKVKEASKLMVIGSGVQEDRLCVGKNQVGVQIDSNSKQNILASAQRLPQFKTGSSSKMGGVRGKEEKEGGWDKLARLDNKAVKLFRI